MVGTPNRSGGRNRKPAGLSKTDGKPEVPRELSRRASEIFDWLLIRLGVSDKGSPWRKVDGVLLASLSEAVESEERLSMMLESSPEDISLFRLRGQYADRVARMSALVGLCPRDRDRLPKDGEPKDGDDAFQKIMARMGRG